MSVNRETSPPAYTMVVTCEHGGNHIPKRYRSLFADADDALNSHLGFDPGALQLSRKLSSKLGAPLFFSTTSRLLIELNRTLGHPRVFSKWSRRLSQTDRQMLVDCFYYPYRKQVVEWIQAHLGELPVLHLSIHSFTPVMNGKTRQTDIGLLFDPSRPQEVDFCHRWRHRLRESCPDLHIHFNRPYRGTSDGFTVALRQQFPNSAYMGIELEVNQKFVLGPRDCWRQLQQRLLESLECLTTATHRNPEIRKLSDCLSRTF